ncbi:hypothetical protein RP726_05465 [Candidatus Methylospira mobilis]|uniref:hypothetical protein n=1 Tax=Candidatus Methylospira mobilis TaxID=1808979 RepID=UPI0028E6B07F|nr:hypothetical protein [Candidatus Methylospira mobilis]WNV05860.1 hypothetical protein RP726_05465 [Candidatus Methylospira mobilis]
MKIQSVFYCISLCFVCVCNSAVAGFTYQSDDEEKTYPVKAPIQSKSNDVVFDEGDFSAQQVKADVDNDKNIPNSRTEKHSAQVQDAPVPPPAVPPIIHEKPVYNRPEPITVLGSVEDAFRQTAKRWSQDIDWNVDKQSVFNLRFGVLLNGKSLKEDLMTLSAAVERDDFHLLFDRYKNGVVVITQSGVTPSQAGETPPGIVPPSATGIGVP